MTIKSTSPDRTSTTTRLRRGAFVVFKLGITVALIYWLLSNADYVAIGAMLSRLGATLLVAAIALHITGFAVSALRWWLLLRHTSPHARFADVAPSYFLGLFFNNILPTGVGGDVVRTLHLTRRGLNLKALAASMIMDRGIGLFAMLFLTASCAVLLPQVDLDGDTRNSALLFLAVGMAGIAVAVSPWAGAFLARLRRRYEKTKLRQGVFESMLMCYSYRDNPGLLLLAALLSVIAQSLIILVYIFLGRGIGIDLPLATFFVVIPIVFVSAMLPISIGGLGVREGTLVGLLIAFGADRQLAIGLSLLYLFVLWLSAMPGAAILLTRPPPASDNT